MKEADLATPTMASGMPTATGERAVRDALRHQGDYCISNGAPITGRISAALADALSEDSATGRRVLAWAQPPIPDALSLRLVGGIHALYLRGELPELDRVFDGSLDSIPAIADLLAGTLVTHDHALMPWLDSPPQTNEAARSASLMAGLAWLADKGFDRVEILEIGSSAGLNLMIDRYRFELGGNGYGPADSKVKIEPEWRGSPPPSAQPAIVSTRGVDLNPVDVTDAAAAERLRAYVWHDNRARFQRLDGAIAMIRERPVELERGSAADWIEARLAEPRQPGAARILMHSVVWQYVSDADKQRIEAAMAEAGAACDADTGLAWLSLEANRDVHVHELRVRHWPDGGETQILARAHPHGVWVEWLD